MIANTYRKIDGHILREAELKDAKDLARVQVITWQSHYRGQVADEFLDQLSIEEHTQKWTRDFSHAKSKFTTFVSEINHKIVGFCKVGPSRDTGASEETGELYSIYLDPAYHGKGIGVALMNTGLNFLREQEFEKATLWVLKSNFKAIAFYESTGWKTDGAERKDSSEGYAFDDIRFSIDL